MFFIRWIARFAGGFFGSGRIIQNIGDKVCNMREGQVFKKHFRVSAFVNKILEIIRKTFDFRRPVRIPARCKLKVKAVGTKRKISFGIGNGQQRKIDPSAVFVDGLNGFNVCLTRFSVLCKAVIFAFKHKYADSGVEKNNTHCINMQVICDIARDIIMRLQLFVPAFRTEFKCV